SLPGHLRRHGHRQRLRPWLLCPGLVERRLQPARRLHSSQAGRDLASMSNEVYANTREVSCKAAAGKSIAAFPDVCLSPPSPPAGPVPIPYPNTATASDTSGGSKTVQISGQEVMLKDS